MIYNYQISFFFLSLKYLEYQNDYKSFLKLHLLVCQNMAHVGQLPKHKKKKKENFLRQTKRYGKKGNYGKGKRLSEDEYHYYMRVFEQMKHVEGEEKGMLVNLLGFVTSDYPKRKNIG